MQGLQFPTLESIDDDEPGKGDHKVIFIREVFVWRAAQAILWTFFCESLYIYLFLFVINFEFFHPLSWMEYILTPVVVSPWSTLVLFVCLTGIGVLRSIEYMNVPPVYTNRFSVLRSLLYPNNLALLTLHMILGSLVYLTFRGESYGVLVKTDEHGTSYIVEKHVFLILSGAFIGLYYFIDEHMIHYNQCFLEFPIVQEPKFTQIKHQLIPTVKVSAYESILPTLYFILLYLTSSGIVLDSLCCFMHWEIDDNSINLWNFIFNLHIFFFAWIHNVLFLLTIKTLKLCLKVFFTEQYVFPICTIVKDIEIVRLADALSVLRFPLLHYLGYFDLLRLSENSQRRRQEIFSISHPGGIPRNWNGIFWNVKELLSLFQAELEYQNPVSTITHRGRLLVRQTPIIGIPSQPMQYAHGVRILGREYQTENRAHFNVQQIHLMPNIQYSCPSFHDRFKLYIFNVWWWLQMQPGFSYLFSDIMPARPRRALNNCQPVIWACQALGSLIAASFAEDRYGVVQKDLSKLLELMLDLKDALDKIPGRSLKKIRVDHDILMKESLKSAIKRSLYKICVVFGESILDVNEDLAGYLDFHE